jgi:2,4-dienoyl-CoA reductase-like NADH-dependent reductase (Old Yellow Enzyme family)
MPLPTVTKAGMRMVGSAFFKEYPWQPLYFLEQARQFRAAVSMPLILLGGITDHAGMTTAMDEGFEFVAMGRALLREPDLINRIRASHDTPSQCIHCTMCMSTIYVGTHCHLAEPFGADSHTGGAA